MRTRNLIKGILSGVFIVLLMYLLASVRYSVNEAVYNTLVFAMIVFIPIILFTLLEDVLKSKIRQINLFNLTGFTVFLIIAFIVLAVYRFLIGVPLLMEEILGSIVLLATIFLVLYLWRVWKLYVYYPSIGYFLKFLLLIIICSIIGGVFMVLFDKG